ncbi:hypothetical protein PITC_063250 [Penicillium italicum]|uniref:Uncharacterized protein n=1 Tax=Penicillium italicum TaxID=40296 RepID=A0A0A2KU13_PENIT|nr:hypothetical protein PITC_063250 [Penicillium italicum]
MSCFLPPPLCAWRVRPGPFVEMTRYTCVPPAYRSRMVGRESGAVRPLF